ncbi:hypothetical protein Syun_030929 [Stephania yunnanensis]|uniref:Protein kinase domain-containing protein n=1 Tax=Stephania yunnanensis TaxID=152371 RepID=A0AAP0E098_9MAGN
MRNTNRSRDLKPSNILLDEDMVAHVGDFGLAKFLQGKNKNSSSTNNTSSFSPRGTIGYIPPEYGVGVKPSTQGDMHSYGVLLLEMFTGKRPTDEEFEDGLYLHQFCKIALHKGVMKIIDPRVLEHEEEEEEANDGHRDILVNNSEIQRSTRHEGGKRRVHYLHNQSWSRMFNAITNKHYLPIHIPTGDAAVASGDAAVAIDKINLMHWKLSKDLTKT